MKKAIALFYLVFLQPPALLTWAGIILFFFTILHLLGSRELTTVLSGTFPSELEPYDAAARASLYLVSYFSAILLAPIMILACVFRLGSSFIQASLSRRQKVRTNGH